MATSITWRRAPVTPAPVSFMPAMPEVRVRNGRNQAEINEILRLYDQGSATNEIAKRVQRSASFCKAVRRQHRPASAFNRVLTPAEADHITQRLHEVPVTVVQSETNRGWATLMKLAQESDDGLRLRKRGAPIDEDERAFIIELLKAKPVRTVQRTTGRSYDTLRKMAGLHL